MSKHLVTFCEAFAAEYRPPQPYRGQGGGTWLVSRVWSDYTRQWLQARYGVRFEIPAGGGRRLDAGLWADRSLAGPMNIALEWEWDNSKVFGDFPEGDFRKILEADSECGIALIHTRTDGRRGPGQAEGTLEALRSAYRVHNRDGRPVGVIEIRRLAHSSSEVRFAAARVHLDSSRTEPIGHWTFSA